MNAHKKIFVTSVSKAVDRAKFTGSLDLFIPGLYNMYADLVEWIDELNTVGITKHNKLREELKQRMAQMRYRHPDQICNYKTVIDIDSYVPNQKPYNGITDTSPETTPTVTGSSIALLSANTHTFSYENFTANYTDPSGAIPQKVIIYISSTAGAFTFDSNPVSGTFEFNINEVNKLVYTRGTEDVFNTSFNFRIVNSMNAISNLATNTVTGESTNNQPATIGDHTMTVDNGVTTTLTMSMFTATYSDPEGDLIDAIRIDDIQTTNIGKFYLSGVEIYEGQVIMREDVEAGKFTHTSGTSDAIATDSFTFSVRDEGSGIWVN